MNVFSEIFCESSRVIVNTDQINIEANVVVRNKTSVSVLVDLHEGHHYVFRTLATSTFLIKFLNPHPKLRVCPERAYKTSFESDLCGTWSIHTHTIWPNICRHTKACLLVQH